MNLFNVRELLSRLKYIQIIYSLLSFSFDFVKCASHNSAMTLLEDRSLTTDNILPPPLLSYSSSCHTVAMSSECLKPCL